MHTASNAKVEWGVNQAMRRCHQLVVNASEGRGRQDGRAHRDQGGDSTGAKKRFLYLYFMSDISTHVVKLFRSPNQSYWRKDEVGKLTLQCWLWRSSEKKSSGSNLYRSWEKDADQSINDSIRSERSLSSIRGRGSPTKRTFWNQCERCVTWYISLLRSGHR